MCFIFTKVMGCCHVVDRKLAIAIQQSLFDCMFFFCTCCRTPTQHYALSLCRADAPTKTDLNGKVLSRLRSTAATALVPQSGLARSSSSLSGEFQLGMSALPVPSISRLGSIAAGPPQLNRLAGAVGLGAARRSPDLPLQQLMGMQTPGKNSYMLILF